jgi:hypothetical protein
MRPIRRSPLWRQAYYRFELPEGLVSTSPPYGAGDSDRTFLGADQSLDDNGVRTATAIGIVRSPGSGTRAWTQL